MPDLRTNDISPLSVTHLDIKKANLIVVLLPFPISVILELITNNGFRNGDKVGENGKCNEDI